MIIEFIIRAVISLVIGFVIGYVGELIYDRFSNKKKYNVSKSKVKGDNSIVIQNLKAKRSDDFNGS